MCVCVHNVHCVTSQKRDREGQTESERGNGTKCTQLGGGE